MYFDSFNSDIFKFHCKNFTEATKEKIENQYKLPKW